VSSSSSILLRLLVTGLGVETSVMALVGVDKSYSSIFLDILLVTGLGVETVEIALDGVANGSENDGCCCVGSAVLDGSTVTFFLPLFLFGFGGAGSGASDS